MPRPPAETRRAVYDRAGGCCEYCGVPEDLAASAHQVDHVVAEKHGGPTVAVNLALSCTPCNRRKGSDISSIDSDTGEIVPLFNPRTQVWSDHFRIEGALIFGTTPEGRATASLLGFNSPARVVEREAMLLSLQGRRRL